jgi:MFS family permease
MLTLSIFLQPITEAMGWSRSAIAMAAMLNFLCMGVGAFMWGALSDRYGTRTVVLCGGALLGLGMVLASRAESLLQFQLLFGVIVGVASGSFYAPLISTTAKWFTHNRSLAVALVSAGLSVGSTVMAPLSRWLISTYDWRTAMLVIGDLVWLVIIPAAFLVRNPTSAAAAARTTAVAGPELTIGQVVRTPQFAVIALTHFACCAAHSGPIFHMVTHAIDRGVPTMAAATVLSAAGLASLSGKIGCGIFADRVGAKRALVAGLALQAVAIGLYLFTSGLGGFYALALMFGFAYGGVMPLYAIVVREYFGERVMGAAFGAVSLAATLGMALGPWAGGWLYDALGSYGWMFIGSSAIGLGAVAIAFTFRPPRDVPMALPSPSAAH